MAAALAERGAIGRAMPQGDIPGFAPPLCLTKEEADIVARKIAAGEERIYRCVIQWGSAAQPVLKI